MTRLCMLVLALASCADDTQRPTFASAGVVVRPPHSYFPDQPPAPQRYLRAAVDQAIVGDDAKLAYVISLSKFADGEGALQFGFLLLDIEKAVGTSRFRRVLSWASEPDRDRALGYMRAATRMEEHLKNTPET